MLLQIRLKVCQSFGLNLFVKMLLKIYLLFKKNSKLKLIFQKVLTTKIYLNYCLVFLYLPELFYIWIFIIFNSNLKYVIFHLINDNVCLAKAIFLRINMKVTKTKDVSVYIFFCSHLMEKDVIYQRTLMDCGSFMKYVGSTINTVRNFWKTT